MHSNKIKLLKLENYDLTVYMCTTLKKKLKSPTKIHTKISTPCGHMWLTGYSSLFKK